MQDRKEYFKKYKKNNIKRVPLDLPIKDYEILKSHTETTHETVNGFIKRAIKETMQHDKNK